MWKKIHRVMRFMIPTVANKLLYITQHLSLAPAAVSIKGKTHKKTFQKKWRKLKYLKKKFSFFIWPFPNDIQLIWTFRPQKNVFLRIRNSFPVCGDLFLFHLFIRLHWTISTLLFLPSPAPRFHIRKHHIKSTHTTHSYKPDWLTC